ncbi:MAG: 1-acyl-sn-glycerol-3-phosphate acyltransferase [Deltaproteobacteria bacterium]|nr:1-acyl-sn-glycerol-3-phosphate acyltransferase [Deltaproteobacteria bacterium]
MARALTLPVDFAVTALLWLYYTVVFAAIWMPVYLLAAALARDRRRAIQRCNHYYYRSFFALLGWIAPGVRIEIAPELRALRSAVVVCNHLSYLDPLLMMAAFERHTTIVKGSFFRVPVFGWVLRSAGYVPALSADPLPNGMLKAIDGLAAHLTAGGVLFVFPEGTRSRDGELGPFKAGAFRLARRFDAPIELLRVQGTGRVFAPGQWLFRTCPRTRIRLDRIGRVEPGDHGPDGASLRALVGRVEELYRHADGLS